MGLLSPRTFVIKCFSYSTLTSQLSARQFLKRPILRSDLFKQLPRGFRKNRLPGGAEAAERPQFRWSPEAEVPVPGGGETPATGEKIWRAVAFAAAACGGCFVGGVIWQYEAHANRGRVGFPSDFFHDRSADYGIHRPRKAGRWRTQMHNWWTSLSPGEKAFLPICAANVLVWLAWRVPAWRGIMVRYFTSSPNSKSLYAPMVLANFSHYSFLHLFVNMYVLHSFSNAVVHSMGREQFFGFYMSAGIMSSLASYIYKASLGVGGLSLGASGAIMGVVGYVCTVFPDIRLAIIFLPMYSFTAEQAIKAVLLFDTLGAVFKWTVFDHAAHLGGAMFGIVYAFYAKNVHRKRERLMSSWHSFRVGFGRPSDP